MLPKSLIDLSHPLTSQTTVYPGDPPFVMHSVCSIPIDGYTVNALSLGTHTGTHIDAPFHFFAEGQKLHELPLERFVGRALVVDVRHLVRARGRVEWSDVRESLDRNITGGGAGGALASLGPRSEGKIDIMLLWTGWDEWWGERKYFDHPYFGRDVAEELVRMGVRLVGVDTLSPDETVLSQDGGERDDAFAMHEVLLDRGCLVCENLVNLGAFVGGGDAGAEREEVWVSLVPMKVHGADGAPVRAYGWKERCT
jgi:kynurenine formamidase